jgi:hypothetical protein
MAGFLCIWSMAKEALNSIKIQPSNTLVTERDGGLGTGRSSEGIGFHERRSFFRASEQFSDSVSEIEFVNTVQIA